MAIKFKKMNWGKISDLPFASKLKGFAKSSVHANTASHATSETEGAGEHFSKQHSGTIENNPYLQSRALWLDIYGNAEDRYKQSRKLNFRLLVLVGLCILGIIYIGSQSKYIPYVVQVQNGQVIYTGAASSSNFDTMKPALAKFFIQDFVKSARSVSVDGYIEKNNQKKSYALTDGAATTELNTFFKERDPYSVVKKRTISVNVNYVNQLPNQAFQVGWTEISRDSQSGQMLYQKQFVGEFDFKWDVPSQSEFILQNNPFGFYVTNISWTGVK